MAKKKENNEHSKLDRKLDVIGLVMTLLGIITILGLFSVKNGSIMGFWVSFLQKVMGWTFYFFPIGLIVFGLWLLIRSFEKIPRLSAERAFGVVSLYTLLLTILHFFTSPADFSNALATAQNGSGGGYIGALLLWPLQAIFGKGGTIIAFLAWLLLGISFTLDRRIE